jgi:2-polyprenyl-3-methyl-5-hydroxy-6-metoxy-1,4-benzoquinol methylase
MRKGSLWLLAGIVALASGGEVKVVPGGAPAAAPSTKPAVPPGVAEYMGRRVAPAMSFHGGGASWLLRRMREEEERTSMLMPELRLTPGMTVCDLGSGNGYHSLPMAKAVAPGGKVLAVDIQQEMLDQLKERAAAAGVTNVETVLGEVHDPKLPPGSCDLILLVDVYHEFSHPAQMLVAMHKALKPDGLVALVEFRGEDPEVPIKPEHKMTKAQIHKEWEASGFVLAREFDKLPWQHLMFWKRK